MLRQAQADLANYGVPSQCPLSPKTRRKRRSLEMPSIQQLFEPILEQPKLEQTAKIMP